MVRLIIKKTDNGFYELEDDNENIYKLHLNFLDIIENLDKEDAIYMPEKLLDKNSKLFCSSYNFGDIKSKYGREILSLEDSDEVIKVVKNHKEIYLKRLYG